MRYLKNRTEAGQLLAARLHEMAYEDDLLVLALPRGGVPVAFEIAQSLHAPLDVYLVRKLGVPGQEELAMGAISSGGDIVINHNVTQVLNLSHETIEKVAERERLEITRRENVYRRDKPPLSVKGRTILLVDDGLATGSTMQAALEALRKQEAGKIIVAVPVAPPAACKRLEMLADEVLCLATPEPFRGVGQWYIDFTQTSDKEVIELLDRAQQWEKETIPAAKDVTIALDEINLQGRLLLQEGGGQGIIVFVHGTGSGRHHRSNIFVSHQLYRKGFSTLLFDLLTEDEEALDRRTRHLRFNIPVLAQRLAQVSYWLMDYRDTGHLRIGYFGASTGAATALKAATALGDIVGAVVSRGGRPDLVAEDLAQVVTPTLLIVGGEDRDIMNLNKQAQAQMRPDLARMEVIPGAGHLFEEPGCLEKVAEQAANWFMKYLLEDQETAAGGQSKKQSPASSWQQTIVMGRRSEDMLI